MSEHHHTSAATIAPLLPCPFCGGQASLCDTGVTWLMCDDCQAEGPVAEAEREAVEKWNGRSGGAAQAASLPLAPEEIARCIDPRAWNDIHVMRRDIRQREALEKANAILARAAQPPAAPVEKRTPLDLAPAELNQLATEAFGEAAARARSSAANGDALSIAETDREVMRQAIVEACDLLAERKYGNPARSPGHNARLVLERALSTGIPALPQEALRYAATKAVEAYRRAQSEGEVVIAMENLERALSPDEPRRSVTRPQIEAGAGPHPSQHHSQGE
jgi:Lar family restriction alleviation protein